MTVVRLLCVVAIVSVSFALTGCASIIHGGSQAVDIRSTPSQAEVKVYDEKNRLVVVGETPCSLELSRNTGYFSSASYTVLIRKEGYEEHRASLASRVSKWYIYGNILGGAVVGWVIVDPWAGGMWYLEPEQVTATLRKKEGVASASAVRPPGKRRGGS